ncbi:MAG: hypothetical protein ACFFCI_02405 [Promethearchaeota archaeon]
MTKKNIKERRKNGIITFMEYGYFSLITVIANIIENYHKILEKYI